MYATGCAPADVDYFEGSPASAFRFENAALRNSIGCTGHARWRGDIRRSISGSEAKACATNHHTSSISRDCAMVATS